MNQGQGNTFRVLLFRMLKMMLNAYLAVGIGNHSNW